MNEEVPAGWHIEPALKCRFYMPGRTCRDLTILLTISRQKWYTVDNKMYLDERKQKILSAVVRDYVETVKPLGSEELAARPAAAAHECGAHSVGPRVPLLCGPSDAGVAA